MTLHTIAATLTKEVITDTARRSARVLPNPRHVSRTGRGCTNPGNTSHDVRSPWANYPVLIGGIGVYPISGHSGSLQIFIKRKSTVSDKIGNNQKLDTSIDRKLSNFGCELSHGSSAEPYSRCRMDFSSNYFQTLASHFVELGIMATNTLDEVNIFGNPATIIINLKDGSHWYAPDHVFGEATEDKMSATRSEQEYRYKTDFKFGGKIRTLCAKIIQ